MTTFKDLLSRKHDYVAADFGPREGEVAIDSSRGIVQPLGKEGKALALNDVFKVGQYVSLDLHGAAADRLRFVVIGINRDGLTGVSAQGEEGFLPWELMAGALRRSQQVYVDVLSEIEDLDEHEQALVHEEIGRLSREIRHHRFVAEELSEQLAKLKSASGPPSRQS